jgi:hypothetical protein
VCGKVQPNLPADSNLSSHPGLTASGNGLIYISPRSKSEVGAHATLARFVAEYPGLTISSSSVVFPGITGSESAPAANRKPCPSGTPDAGRRPQLTINVWPTITSAQPVRYSAPSKVRLVQGELITIGVVPSGTTLPKPLTLTPPLLNAIAAESS